MVFATPVQTPEGYEFTLNTIVDKIYHTLKGTYMEDLDADTRAAMDSIHKDTVQKWSTLEPKKKIAEAFAQAYVDKQNQPNAEPFPQRALMTWVVKLLFMADQYDWTVRQRKTWENNREGYCEMYPADCKNGVPPSSPPKIVGFPLTIENAVWAAQHSSFSYRKAPESGKLIPVPVYGSDLLSTVMTEKYEAADKAGKNVDQAKQMGLFDIPQNVKKQAPGVNPNDYIKDEGPDANENAITPQEIDFTDKDDKSATASSYYYDSLVKKGLTQHVKKNK